jgi:hypothetical protein
MWELHDMELRDSCLFVFLATICCLPSHTIPFVGPVMALPWIEYLGSRSDRAQRLSPPDHRQ